MQGIKQFERGCVQQKYEYDTCMTGLTIYYKKTCDRARRDRYKNVKLWLNSKGCHGLMCADCIPRAKTL